MPRMRAASSTLMVAGMVSGAVGWVAVIAGAPSCWRVLIYMRTMQNRILRTEKDVRREVERRLRRPLDDGYWDDLVAAGRVNDVIRAFDADEPEDVEDALGGLVEEARRLVERYVPRVRSSAPRAPRAEPGSVLAALS